MVNHKPSLSSTLSSVQGFVLFCFEVYGMNLCVLVYKVHQFERDLEKLRTRHKTEMEQKLKQMSADERRLLKHIKDKHDNDMKIFLSDQKAAYKAAKNQFKKVSVLSFC